MASVAYATQLPASGIKALNPSPVSYVFTNTNAGYYFQSASLTVSSGSLQSVVVKAYCTGNNNPTITATITIYNSAGSSIGSGSAAFSNCQGSELDTLTATISPAPSMANVAKVMVALT